ncbi:hypothetical protein MASR2M15_26980 [Anaerolineales bacterium]
MDPLTTTNVKAYFDLDSRIVYIHYNGILGADVTASVYEWLEELLEWVGTENILGEIFDFRNVVEFTPDNLMEARSKSRTMNFTRNTKAIPVAMVVDDPVHEQILRGPMRNVPEKNPRKIIVDTMSEAIAFIQNWHKENAS